MGGLIDILAVSSEVIWLYAREDRKKTYEVRGHIIAICGLSIVI